MSDWTERFANHPVHSEIVELESLLAATAELVASDTAAIDAHGRLNACISFVKARLGSLQPQLVPLAPLNTLASHLAKVKGVIQAAANEKNPAQVVNAASTVDNVLVHTAPLAGFAARSEAEGLQQALTVYHKTVTDNLQRHQEKAAAVSATLKQVESKEAI